MKVRHMRLALGLFFLAAGVGLLVGRFAAPEQLGKAFNLTRLTIGACLAVVLGGVNLSKWYAGRLAYEQLSTPVRLPLRPDPEARTRDEPNPAFDFGDPAPRDKS
jgi:hypothetical protein